jgi:hypothetical protein
MRKIIAASLLIAIALVSMIAIVHAQGVSGSTVTFTANTDQSQYSVYSQVTFNESMAYNNVQATNYPSDGLVGVQMTDPNGNTMVIRTLRTGTTTPYSIPAKVSQAYLSNSQGNQIGSISIPSSSNNNPYFYFNVVNNLQTQQTVLVTLNVFDSNGVPILVTYQQLTLAPSGSSENILEFAIPSWTHFGTAYAYVNVYSNWPSQGGYPLGIEYPFTFTITGGTAFQGTPPTTTTVNSGPTHYFEMMFRMPKDPNNALNPADGVIGTYTIYSSTSYSSTHGFQTTTFQYLLLGDLNGDGVINFSDITSLVSMYIAYYEDHIYYVQIDFSHQGTISFNDITDFVSYYIQYWSS